MGAEEKWPIENRWADLKAILFHREKGRG